MKSEPSRLQNTNKHNTYTVHEFNKGWITFKASHTSACLADWLAIAIRFMVTAHIYCEINY